MVMVSDESVLAPHPVVYKWGVTNEPSITRRSASSNPQTAKDEVHRPTYSAHVGEGGEGKHSPDRGQSESRRIREYHGPGELPDGEGVVGNVSGSLLSFIVVGFGVDHTQSTKDSQVGLEDKGIFNRRQQAREYLQKAERTHKIIQVCRIMMLPHILAFDSTRMN